MAAQRNPSALGRHEQQGNDAMTQPLSYRADYWRLILQQLAAQKAARK